MKMEDILRLMEQANKSNFTAFSIKDGDFEMKMERQPNVVAASAEVAAAPVAAAPAPAVQEDTNELTGNVVTAPIVGIYYQASAPGAKPYVTVGQSVKKGDVLFTIEAMKLFNEVVSEYDGVVKAVLCKDGEMVQFDQPIMVIE